MKAIKLFSKSFLTKSAVSVTLSLLLCGTASAGEHFGRIAVYDLNGTVPGRDACVQQVPALTTLWGCVYNNNPLRNQISTLLREAREQNKSCWLTWENLSSQGDVIITHVQC